MLSSLLDSLEKSSNKNGNDKRSNEKRGKYTFSCGDSLYIFPFAMVIFFLFASSQTRKWFCLLLLLMKNFFSIFEVEYVRHPTNKYMPPN